MLRHSSRNRLFILLKRQKVLVLFEIHFFSHNSGIIQLKKVTNTIRLVNTGSENTKSSDHEYPVVQFG